MAARRTVPGPTGVPVTPGHRSDVERSSRPLTNVDRHVPSQAGRPLTVRSPSPHLPQAATALEHSPPHRECDDEGHRTVVPPFSGETVWTAPKYIGHEKCWQERRSEWRKFGVFVMRNKGYEVGDTGTADYQQCQPEARSSFPNRIECAPYRKTTRSHCHPDDVSQDGSVKLPLSITASFRAAAMSRAMSMSIAKLRSQERLDAVAAARFEPGVRPVDRTLNHVRAGADDAPADLDQIEA